MKYTSFVSEEIAFVDIEGDMIAAETSLDLLELLNEKINEGIKYCGIDLSNVRFINSGGIGLIVTIYTKFKNKGGEAFVINPSESIQKLLQITKLSSVIKEVESKEALKEKIKSKSHGG